MKGVLISLVFLILTVAFLLMRDTPSEDAKINPSPAPVVNEPPALPVSLPANLSKQDVIESASRKTQSLNHLEGRYLSRTEEELEREIQSSRTRLSSSGLLLKAESQLLDEGETILVLTEIRRQHVLFNLLTRKKLENLRRTYL